MSRLTSLIVLAVAVGGIAYFSRGLRVIDTIGFLVSGAAAGIALASLAARRR